jgi:hypothetical protein
MALKDTEAYPKVHQLDTHGGTLADPKTQTGGRPDS